MMGSLQHEDLCCSGHSIKWLRTTALDHPVASPPFKQFHVLTSFPPRWKLLILKEITKQHLWSITVEKPTQELEATYHIHSQEQRDNECMHAYKCSIPSLHLNSSGFPA